MSGNGNDAAIRLTRQIADAVAAGDREQAVRLTRQLERRLMAADSAELAGPGVPAGVPGTDTPDFAAEPAVVTVARKPQASGSGRKAVAGALAEIGVACRARVVADYAEARFGLRVETRALSALRRDERRAWANSSARPTYIVPALEGRYFQPVRGLLTLSDWPLEHRLIGPWSERADHLAATAQLARQLAWLSERDPSVAKRLAPVVAGMAASIPGALDDRDVDTARIESAAEAELAPLSARDEPWRQEAASRARHQLGAEEQLWGVSIGVVAEGDSR